jgi:eukaryotic translation initiation factor 2C
LALAKEIKENLLIRAPPKRPFAKRPGFMTEGRTVTLLTNHFLLSVGNKEAFHYDIEIKAKPKKIEKSENIVDKEVNENVKESKCTKFSRKIATKLNRKIFQQMIKSYSGLNQVFYGINPVYDGQKNMFTSKILDGTGSTGADKRSIRLTVDLEENERISTFYVNIKMAETNYKIELNVLNQYNKGITCDDDAVKKSILFINTLLRHKSSMEMIPIGQSIFDPKICGQEISKFVLLSYGYYSSVRNLMIGTTLNIDRSAACFYKPSKITDFIGDILRGNLSKIPKIDDFERRQIKKALSGLQIEATHISYPGTNGPNYRKYRVLGVSVYVISFDNCFYF